MKISSAHLFAGLLLAAAPVRAHHSPAAMYDISRVVALQGVVTEVQWVNPHAHLFLDVTDEAGTTVNWDVEFPAPAALMMRTEGRLTRNDIKPGDRITVDVWLGKDGKHQADSRIITLADGRMISCRSGWDPPYNFRR
jgi:hypothetical protein